MVTLERLTRDDGTSYNEFRGLENDPRPIANVNAGDIFIEKDTSRKWVFANGDWDRVEESNHGGYLGIWNPITGLPAANPGKLPYTYKAGDNYKIGTTGDGNYVHTITIAGTSSSEGIYTGTYNVTFSLINSVSAQYATIASIADAIGEGNTIDATGTLVTADQTFNIVKVLKWPDSQSNSVIALVDEGFQKLALTATTATTLTDTVTGGVNHKPTGSSYNGTASTTVETNSIATGDAYFYDGTNWTLQINHASSGSAPTATTVTIAVADWNGGTTCTKTVQGVTGTNVVIVDPSDATVECTAQATNSLTFTASTTPTEVVTVKVVIF